VAGEAGVRKSLLFVNKKKQKNFVHSPATDEACPMSEHQPPSKGMKFFCFFLFTKRSASFALALVLLTASLAACGRKGPPQPPGPPDQVVYPRVYPAR
jgi:hypothetical protein